MSNGARILATRRVQLIKISSKYFNRRPLECEVRECLTQAGLLQVRVSSIFVHGKLTS